MANTPYIDLVKPAGTDKALISVLNANSDKIDSAVGGVQDALAIVCNGNTHGAITSGQYVYVRAHETLQEGLYKANSNIAANAALNSTNLTADSSGGLNSLNEQIATLIAKNKDCTITKLVINSTSFTVNVPNNTDCWINFYGTTYNVAAMDKKIITFSILIRNSAVHGTYVIENGEASSSLRVTGCSVSNGVATITTNVNFLMFGIAEAYSWT